MKLPSENKNHYSAFYSQWVVIYELNVADVEDQVNNILWNDASPVQVQLSNNGDPGNEIVVDIEEVLRP